MLRLQLDVGSDDRGAYAHGAEHGHHGYAPLWAGSAPTAVGRPPGNTRGLIRIASSDTVRQVLKRYRSPQAASSTSIRRLHEVTALSAPTGLTAQDRNLVPQHQDFRVFRGVAAREERQPAEQPDHEQIDEAKEHGCRG